MPFDNNVIVGLIIISMQYNIIDRLDDGELNRMGAGIAAACIKTERMKRFAKRRNALRGARYR
jgi:hypothetical protein